jgi:hypothetical protein
MTPMCAAKPEETEGLLMPKATAMWLIDNTALTFEQVADFTGLHSIEVQALADEEVGRGIVGRNPIDHLELTPEELEKAIADSSYMMRAAKSENPGVKTRSKGPRYTPVSKRGDKPDAIAYLLKHHPEITDAQLQILIGTTKPTIQSVRERSHPNSQNIKPRHPVDLGLCTYSELEQASRKGLRAQGKDPDEVKNSVLENREQPELDEPKQQPKATTGFDFSNFLKRSGE